MTINIYFLKFEKVEKIDYNSNSSFECNTESGSKESLSIVLGLKRFKIVSKILTVEACIFPV